MFALSLYGHHFNYLFLHITTECTSNNIRYPVHIINQATTSEVEYKDMSSNKNSKKGFNDKGDTNRQNKSE
jgi:hypothetical protein